MLAASGVRLRLGLRLRLRLCIRLRVLGMAWGCDCDCWQGVGVGQGQGEGVGELSAWLAIKCRKNHKIIVNVERISHYTQGAGACFCPRQVLGVGGA